MKSPEIESPGKKINYSAFYHEKTYFNNNRPEYFNLKALLRDESGNIRKNYLTCIQVYISRSSTSDTIIYSEAHPVVTNAIGLIKLQIGLQNPPKFRQINWIRGPYFLKVIVDGYEIMTKILLSVI